MAYFKINHSGCNERKGLCEIRYDLFLDPEDYGYDQHYVNVPVWPEGGYPGKVDAMGQPVNQKDYDKWFAALPRVWQNNPFCCHFMQHEPTITDEEILAAGEKFLAMGYANWQKGNLHLNKNETVKFTADAQKKVLSVARIEAVKATVFAAFEKTIETNYSIR